MPLTKKGRKILRAMKGQYGSEKGEQVFHASAQKGTIKSVKIKGGSVHALPAEVAPAYECEPGTAMTEVVTELRRRANQSPADENFSQVPGDNAAGNTRAAPNPYSSDY